MGYAERSYSYRFGDPSGGGGGMGRLFGSVTPWVRRLVLANGAVWLLMWANLLPPEWTIRTFGFSVEGLLARPWSPLTYMFVHGGFWHVLVNMVVLFFFGPHLERAWGGREFLKFYLAAGLGGALVALLFLPLPETLLSLRIPQIDPSVPLVGASGAIFGLMLAFALMWPDTRVYLWFVLPIRAKWFMLILGAFTLYATFSGGGGGVAHWAHLGGLVTGFGYLKWGGGLSRAVDPLFDRVAAIVGKAKKGPGGGKRGRGRSGRRRRTGRGEDRRRSERSAAAGRGPGDRRTDEDGEPTSEEMLDEVDRILDKIREGGLDSLSEEEREFLDEMSRRYRG